MRIPTPSAPLLVVIALLLSGTSLAQNEKPAVKNETPATGLLNLKFPGGTVADYIAAVAKSAGGANVFVAPEAAQVPMPAIDLQNVTVANALGVLHGRVHNDPRQSITLMYSEGGAFAENEQPIFSITANVSGSRDAKSLYNRIWSIAMLQSNQISADDMLTAIQAALDLIGEHQAPAQLRLHESTGLLIARGSVEQLGTINEAIERLEQSAAIRAAASQERRTLQQKIEEQSKTIEQLLSRIASLEAQLAQYKAQ